jgi:diguanylate cyclase (GGDEF)-like protein/PAS domain S-box-containing protein
LTTEQNHSAAQDRALRAGRIAASVLAALVCVYVLDAGTGAAPDAVHRLLIDWLTPAAFYVTVACCLVAARRGRRDAVAWRLLAAGIFSYGTGFLVHSIAGGGAYADAPVACHVMWLALFPFAYAALILFLRARLEHFPRSVWLDGVIVSLTLCGLVAAFALPAFTDAAGDSFGVLALLIYPLGDVVLLTFAAVALSLARWRAGWGWSLMAAAFAVFAVGDVVLAYLGATDDFVRGSLIDTSYIVATLLIAAAALTGLNDMPRRPTDAPRLLVLPFACAGINIVLIFVDQFVDLPNDDVILAMPAVALALARGLITLGDVRRLYESRRFERGFEDAAIGMAVIGTDLTYLRVNDALSQMLGRAPDQIVGLRTVDITHADDLEVTHDVVAGAFESGDDMRFSKRLRHADGSYVDVMIASTLVHDDGEQYFFSQIQDVTRERRAERQKEAIAGLGRFALVTTDVQALAERAVETVTAALGVQHCTLVVAAGEEQLRVEAGSMGMKVGTMLPRMGLGDYVLRTGQSTISHDVVNDTRFTLTPQAKKAGVRRAMAVPVLSRRGGDRVLNVFQRDDNRRFGDDDLLFLESVANVLASAFDRAEAEEELRRRALEDPLTGLANRALLGSHLERALYTSLRHNVQIAVMMIDLDRFKYLNDTLGHGIGDELLCAVAERLRGAVRDEDLVARLGGDEFVVVCAEAESDAAIGEVAQRLVDVLAQPFGVAGRELHVSASVGVTVANEGASADSLLRDADAAMYRAKERGGGRFEVFDAALRARLVHRVSTEEALRRALGRDELAVRYQPIVDPRTGEVHSFEALLRWHHPERGIVSPTEFVPVAEETGLIVPIGAWVLRTACEQAAAWNELRGPDRPLAISVNLSPRQVRPELLFEVRRALAGTIPPSLLMLEITESLLLEPDSTLGVIADLRELGVMVALDDFGSGYSSLSYLQSYPLDFVKLDRGFVQALDASERTAAVVRAAIEMAGALGHTVVAEGVQRPEQLARLRELGCDLVQGFLFAPALEPGEAAELLNGVDLATAVTLPAPAPLRAPRVGSV